MTIMLPDGTLIGAIRPGEILWLFLTPWLYTSPGTRELAITWDVGRDS